MISRFKVPDILRELSEAMREAARIHGRPVWSGSTVRPKMSPSISSTTIRKNGSSSLHRQADGRNVAAGSAVRSVLRRGRLELTALSRFEATRDFPEVLADFLFRVQLRTELAERRRASQGTSNGFSIIIRGPSECHVNHNAVPFRRRP